MQLPLGTPVDANDFFFAVKLFMILAFTNVFFSFSAVIYLHHLWKELKRLRKITADAAPQGR